jgi:hypothetical protein
MIEITIDFKDDKEIVEKLILFGRDAPSIFDKILRQLSKRFRDFTRNNLLNGQMLEKRSGTLWRSLHHGKRRGTQHIFRISAQPNLANIYEHAGGANILPNRRKILAWPADPFHRSRNAGWWRGLGKGEIVFAHSVHLKERPFMTRAVNWFNFPGEFQGSSEVVFAREFKARGMTSE